MATSYSLFRTTPTDDSAAPSTEGVAVSADPATVYSKAWAARRQDCGWGLTVRTDGTLTGTWTLWASDLKHPPMDSDAGWVDTSTHADFAETNPAGSATAWRVNSTLIKATWLKLKFVRSNGSGNVFADVTAE